MRKLLTCATIAMALTAPFALGAETGDAAKADASGQSAAGQYKYKSPRLNRAELDTLLAKPESLLLIDVRRPDELTAIGGLPVYLSVQAADLEKSLAFIPKDRTIVTVSNHAGRAGAAADLLSSHGFKVAGAVGVQNYQAEGGALTKIAPLAPLATTAQPSAVEQKYKTLRLKRSEIDALLAKPDGLLFIDVRRPDEVTKIGGFPVYLSIQVNDVEKDLALIPKDRTIVTIANHFVRNEAVGDLLSSHGFKVAGAIGVEDYEAEGGNITKIAPPAPAAAAR